MTGKQLRHLVDTDGPRHSTNLPRRCSPINNAMDSARRIGFLVQVQGALRFFSAEVTVVMHTRGRQTNKVHHFHCHNYEIYGNRVRKNPRYTPELNQDRCIKRKRPKTAD